MEKSYEIVITGEHLAGDKWIESDCPGARAFQDALPSEVYLEIPTEPINYRLWSLTNNNTWCNNKHVWESYKKDSNGELDLFNMMRAEVGDEVVFKKY